MKKPRLKDSLARKPDVTAAAAPPPIQQATRSERLTDRRINTTLRLEPEKLERLKIIAARKRSGSTTCCWKASITSWRCIRSARRHDVVIALLRYCMA